VKANGSLIVTQCSLFKVVSLKKPVTIDVQH
jgi:hypothetical protein